MTEGGEPGYNHFKEPGRKAPEYRVGKGEFFVMNAINRKKIGKNSFIAGVLLLMVMLALGTLRTFAEEGAKSSSSYVLTIRKVFADGTPDNVVAEAAKQKYTFRVEAKVKNGGENETVEKVVTITGEDEGTVEFSNAFKVSVIEQTDGGGFEVPNGTNEPFIYDVSETECLSEMHVNASKATVHISKDNGRIEISRPEDAPTVTFKLTGEPHHGSQEEFDRKFKESNSSDSVTIAAGGKAEFIGLPQGEYTITKLRAADGFNVLVGSRDFGVKAGETGKVYINGTDSKITIKAPDPVDGVVLTHHYQVSGGNKYTTREIDVLSGNYGAVEHLGEGLYTIKVSETYDGFKGYTVAYPDIVKTADRTGNTSALYTASSGNYKYFSVLNGADYVEVYGFGPMLNASKEAVSSTYKFYYGTRNAETGKIASRNTTVSDEDWRGCTFNAPVKLVVPASDGRVYFLALNVSNASAKYLTVKWREYKEKEAKAPIKDPSADGNVVKVNGITDNYITISKAQDTSDPRGDAVNYYYTIKDSNGNKIENYTVAATDKDGNNINVPVNETFDEKDTTVTLKAGQTVKISGLKSGANYRIYEDIEKAPAKPFDVTLEDTKKIVTTSGGEISITTLDERIVEISRPGKKEDDNEREYTYNIYDENDSETVLRQVKLKSGETKTVAEATGSKLPPGSYCIKAIDDQIVGFDVAFTDSSSLTSDFIRTATVTFTNTFSEVESSYHVIHEYYLKDGDNYTFEGVSPVYTKNCDHNHAAGDGHKSTEVHLLDVFGGNTYTHFGDAYGKVVSWPKGGDAKEVILSEDEKQYKETGQFEKKWPASNGMGTADDPGTREYDYVSLTNKDCAIATSHSHKDGAHEDGAEIIILRYYRNAALPEAGKYNIIHVYYKRTSEGDIWEGSSKLETKGDIDLTGDNRYKTYDADGVEKVFVPGTAWPDDWKEENVYEYDGAAYGRIVESASDSAFNGDNAVGDGKEYRKDDTMTSVKATVEGDQIIILRYYRTGGYKVVHEYYYREKADSAEDSDETEGEPGEDGGEEEGLIQGASRASLQDDADRSDVQGSNSGNTVSGNDIQNLGEDANELGENSSANPVDSEEGAEAQMISAQSEDVQSPNDGNAVSGNDVQAPDDGNGGGDADLSGNDMGGANDSEEIPENPDDMISVLNDDVEALADADGVFKGTLSDSGGYTYDYEGRSEINAYPVALGGEYDARGVKREYVNKENNYSYVFNDAVYGYVEPDGSYRMAPYKTGVTGTEKSEEIIILRYIRGDVPVTPPPEPNNPDNPDPPGDPGGSDKPKDPDPEIPEVPEIPEEPENPGYPTELPDPNDPDSPDVITIWEDGVPRTYVKVWNPDLMQWVYIPDEDAPLAGYSPRTGDDSPFALWLVLAGGSLWGLTLIYPVRSRKQKK